MSPPGGLLRSLLTFRRLDTSQTALHREIDELAAWMHDADEYGRPQFGQLGDRINGLRRIIAEHFALEEEGGCMAEPLAAAPHFADRIRVLMSDHPQLLSRLDALSQRLKDGPAHFRYWGEARTELQQALEALDCHEQEEHIVWQQSLGQATAAAD
jgi:hypothetical protein